VPDGWPRDDAPFTFVTSGGVGQAIALANEVAGDKAVGVAGPNIAQQCLDAGLLDEVRIDLVPVLLGTGIPFFQEVQGARVRLGEPSVIIGDRVTHLRFLVLR
jgi:dihydrofolate reductase